jgi:hypothetical protein
LQAVTPASELEETAELLVCKLLLDPTFELLLDFAFELLLDFASVLLDDLPWAKAGRRFRGLDFASVLRDDLP